MRWEEILLLADMDGTLLGRDLRIPERNLAAIREFMARGGHFSIATGRSIQSGAPYYQQVQPNAPCILLNGVMLYDFRTETVLRVRALPEGAAQWALKLAEEIPGCGLEAYTARDIFALRDSPALQAHLVRERLPFRLHRAEEMGGPCCKLLFAGEPESVAQLYLRCTEAPLPGARVVLSCASHLEVLPAGADKGSGLCGLLQETGFSPGQVCAIGDYYNDRELLEAAAVSAVPENAPQDLKRLARYVVCHCDGGAVADFLERLERDWVT